MQIGNIFQTFTEKDLKKSFKERTRKDVIDEFYKLLVEQAKEEQELAKRKQFNTGIKQKIWPLPKYVIIMSKLAGLQTVAELEWFLGFCKEAKHFSRCFYFKLK